jgi:hypothetical protein
MRVRTVASLTALLLITVMSAAEAAAVHEKESWHHRTFVAHDFNICGDLGTFTFDTSGHVISTDTGAGFHFNVAEVVTYTLVFDDPALGTWSARATESTVFNANPGDTVIFHAAFNSFEGPVKIRERVTLVIGADGVVGIDKAIAEVDGC